jgi:hypothetical protein
VTSARAGSPVTTTRSLWRRLGQALVVVLGWAGFAWMWWLVVQRPWDTFGLVWLIGGSLVLLPVVTLYWVWHNRAIYRRKGPRRAARAVEERYATDWNGRRVQADWPVLRHARSITVQVSDEVKVYALGAAPPRAPRAGRGGV